ncbi:MAG: GNAT family N-acetyltransferase [Pseudomonadota bacterium]
MIVDIAILDIAVVRGRQREGIASRVIEEARRRATVSGIRRYAAYVWSGNDGSLACFQNAGVQIEGQTLVRDYG